MDCLVINNIVRRMGNPYSRPKDSQPKRMLEDDDRSPMHDMMYLFGEDEGKIFSFNPEKHCVEHVQVSVGLPDPGRQGSRDPQLFRSHTEGPVHGLRLWRHQQDAGQDHGVLLNIQSDRQDDQGDARHAEHAVHVSSDLPQRAAVRTRRPSVRKRPAESPRRVRVLRLRSEEMDQHSEHEPKTLHLHGFRRTG